MMSTYLSIKEILSSSWQRLPGAKGTFWLSLLIIAIPLFMLGLCSDLIKTESTLLNSIITVASNLLASILWASMTYIGIQRAKDMPISYKLVFKIYHTNTLINLTGVLIIQFILFGLLPMMIFNIGKPMFSNLSHNLPVIIIAGSFIIFAMVYFSMRLSQAILFVLDQQLNSIKAIKASWEITQGNVLNLIALHMCFLGIAILSILTLGIGVIWTYPLYFIFIGTIYLRLIKNRV